MIYRQHPLRRLFSAPTKYSTFAHVPRVSPKDFATVVKDVAKYPEFIRWVEAAWVTKVIDPSPDREVFRAVMKANFKLYTGDFESMARCEHKGGVYKVVSSCTDTPVFRSMVSTWVVSPLEQGCRADYMIEFVFANMLYQSMSGYFVGLIGKATMNAFVKRAEQLYSNSYSNQTLNNTATASQDSQYQSQSQQKEQTEASNTATEAVTQLPEGEAKFEFLAKKADIEREILIFQTIDLLKAENSLSEIENQMFRELYFKDKGFMFGVRTLFQTFSTREEILANKNRIHYHLRTLLNEHSSEQ